MRTRKDLDTLQESLPSGDSFRVPYGLLHLIMLNNHDDEWKFVSKGGNTSRAYRSTSKDHDFVVFTINEKED